MHNIEKGRKQWLYRGDFDAEIYAKIFFQLVMSYDSSPYIDSKVIDREHYNRQALIMYINSITTAKGREVLESFQHKIK